MEVVESKVPEKLIAIGTSAGGLEPLQTIMSNLPKTLGSASIVVAQHLSPQFKSMMRELLGRKTGLQVEEIKDKLTIEVNKIYTVPPDNDVEISKGKFKLRKPSYTGPKPSINILFTTLAKTYKSKAVGIVLSGTGSDGSDGIKEIKKAGGLTIAQLPESAKYDGMPQAAIGTGKVDYVLPPDEIGQYFKKLIGRVRNFKTDTVEERTENEAQMEETVSRVLSLLEEKVGTNFSNYKTSTIYRRFEKRLNDKKFSSIDKYLSYVQNNGDELENLFKYLLIGVTSFFRNPEAYKSLEPFLEKAIIDNAPNKSYRIWTPGCASGEEAYTLAIMVSEIVSRNNLHDFQAQIFATDIDQNALNKARSGVYEVASLDKVPEKIKSKYFRKKGNQYEVVKQLKQMILFTRHDLTSNPPFLKIDLLCCRNLLIYFNQSLQNHVMPIFHYALKQDGIMFLGKSESIGSHDKYFGDLDSKNKIFRSKPANDLKVSFPHLKPIVPRVPSTPVSKPTTDKESRSLHDMVKETLYNTYEHPYVVVDDNLEMIEVFGEVSPFLKIKPGVANTHVLKLLESDLQLELRAVASKAIGSSKITKGNIRKITINDKVYYLRFIVKPVMFSKQSDPLYMVIFEQIDIDEKLMRTREVVLDEKESPRLVELEHELSATREHMNTLVEELETSNEELQALNEELQSSNEELQASNEELETSNEELQASNEEVEIAYTELRQANEDIERSAKELKSSERKLNSIFDSTLQGFVMIDNNYNIDTFNITAQKFFRLFYNTKLKINKSFIDQIPEEGVESFIKYIKIAFAGKVTSHEQKIPQKNGSSKYLQMTYSPVGEGTNVDKALIAFVDISDLKEAEVKLKNSNEAILKQNERWQGLTLLSPDLIAILKGKDYNFEFVNPSYQRLFPHLKLNGQVLKDVPEVVNDEKLLKKLGEVRNMGQKLIIPEHPLKIKNGKGEDIRYYNFTFSPLQDIKNSKENDIIIYATDVTSHVEHRKLLLQANKETAMEKEKLENLLTNAPAFIAIHKGPDHVLEFANKLYLQFFNKNVIGKKYNEAGSSGSAREFLKMLDEVYSTGEPSYGYEIPRHSLKNKNKLRYFNFILQPWYNTEKKIEGVISFAYEVTAQVETRHTIEANASFINTLNDSMPQKVWTASPAGEYDYLNKPMTEYLGIDNTKKKDYNHIQWNDYIHPEDRRESTIKWNESLEAGMDYNVQHRLKDHQGEFKWHLTRGLPLRNKKGEIIKWIGTSTDIDDQKKSEQLKDEFLSIASHELKTPLTTIQAYTDLLSDKTDDIGDEEVKIYIQKTLSNLKKLNNLISDLLDLSRIQAGKFNFDKEIIDFDRMVKEGIDNVRHATKSHIIKVNGATNKKIKGNYQRLEQAVVNLLGNAVKYSPDNNTITVNMLTEDHKVTFEVVDKGLGIPAKHINNIFERYYRANEKHQFISGLGIGLFITKQIIDMHGGEIAVESVEGKGSKFYFSLPITESK